jgi:hypothetical protein
MAAWEVPRRYLVLELIGVDILVLVFQFVVVVFTYFGHNLLGLLLQIVVKALPSIVHEFTLIFY